MSIQVHPFLPIYAAGKSITAGSSSANTTFTAGGNVLYIRNTHATDGAYVETSQSSATASEVDMYIPPSTTLMLAISFLDDNIGTIRAGSNDVTLHIMPGYTKLNYAWMPFGPIYGSGFQMTAGAASSLTAFTAGGDILSITNTHATDTAYVEVGGLSAGTTDMPIHAGETVYLAMSFNTASLAKIRGGSNDITLNCIPGFGGEGT